MKRCLAAAVATAISLVATAGAAAAERAEVTKRAVSQTRAAVTSYWTPKRMQEATPATPAADATPAVAQAAAFTSGEYPGDYKVPPASAHGKVFFTSHGADYVCSGTAIASTNRSVVWTAGHCVNDGPGAYHTNWAFVPAYRDGTRPLGTWPARLLLTTDAWRTAGNLAFDLGAAVVSTTGGAALTDSVGGGRTIAFNADRNQSYSSFGYPVGSPFTGARLWTCQSPLEGSDPSTSPPTMAIGCDMTSGASGGSWVAGGSVMSVNSYGYALVPGVIYGPYQGAEAQALFGAAQSG